MMAVLTRNRLIRDRNIEKSGDLMLEKEGLSHGVFGVFHGGGSERESDR